MKTILVVDDMAVFREPIAASLRLAGYQTLAAADGAEALRITRAEHPDLILLDVAMPKMDGITCLKHLRADPSTAKTPVILLTALSEKAHILSAASLGVKDYMLKSRFRLAELLDRVKKVEAATAAPGTSVTAASSPVESVSVESPKAIAATPVGTPTEIPRLITREQFLQRVERVFQAKTLSGVVAQVIATATSPRAEMSELANLIARDPMLSARVLQTANSASYASAGPPVTTVFNAIRKVGCTAIRNIAAALGVFDCMPEVGADGFNPIRCWQHSFGVAQLCERFTKANLPDQSGLAYMVGLCHDLGDIFIRTQFSKEYEQLTAMAARTGRPREQLHGEMLGMPLSDMISAVNRCIALPDAIREPIEILHSPNRPRATNPLARILWMAENYANAALLASGPSSEVAPLTHAFCRAAVGDQDPPQPDPQALSSEVLTMTVALARLSRTDEAKLLAPIFSAQKAKLWVARATGISKFDPIGLSLKSMSDATLENRLPLDTEINDIQGLVVVAPTPTTPGFSDVDIERTVARARAAGRSLPVLALTGSGARPGGQANDEIRWRTSAALSDLKRFVDLLDASKSSAAGASASVAA